MLSEYFNNFNMFNNNKVKLVFDNQDLLPSIVDFDFTITNKLNSKLSASINVYNLTIDKLASLKIVCNDAVFFTAQDTNITDLTSRNNQRTSVYSINAKISDLALPTIIEKGTTVKSLNKSLNINGNPLIATKDYIFNSKDSEEAKLAVILKKEGIGAFAVNVIDDLNQQISDLSNIGKDILTTKIDLVGFAKGTIKPVSNAITSNDLLILNITENFAGEELTIISLFSPFLKAGKNINYKASVQPIAKDYTITSVITDWNCNTGLIQTTIAVTGSRLKYFNDHEKETTTTSESEDL